ncbi:MAG: Tetratricopeptide 4 [Bryobacterales bacterium]|nr:Tetratricopeptide 4 [Bryobacterales bacterium]
MLAHAASAQYVGSQACQPCHADKAASQAKSAHAHALKVAAPGAQGYWAFGAGQKATTWVTQKDEESVIEHALTYYSATKTMGLTPGHAHQSDDVYRTFDPVGTALRCFRCHSTGPVSLAAGYKIQPGELGVRCEGCHGPGAAHVQAGGGKGGGIQNPAQLNPNQMNQLCGACHRQATSLDDDTDWNNPWNLRHQPSYLHRAACFRNSPETSKQPLSCVTCHDPHSPIQKAASYYDAKCSACHPRITHKATTSLTGRSCTACHMPQVAVSKNLAFTNHWIGIYEQPGPKLAPVRRSVKALKPSPVEVTMPAGFIVPSAPDTLTSVYEKALAEREAELGPAHAKVARAASDLGMFLVGNRRPADALTPLRRAAAIDEANGDPKRDADRENLATALEAAGQPEEAIGLLRLAAAGKDLRVAARASAALGRLDEPNAEVHFRNALAAEEKASGVLDRRVAVILHELALSLRSKGDDASAEPLLRRALAIQEKLEKPEYRLSVAIMNTLGNLMEGARRFDEAERIETAAMKLAEGKLGPESPELSMTCTNLADVLWNKRDLRGAALLYRRAFTIDASLYGPDRPETAADLANLGMVSKEAGQTAAAQGLLQQALAIYEKTLGASSPQAEFVRKNLAQ